MKIEKRGKYAGVKVHLDEVECLALVAWISAPTSNPALDAPVWGLTNKLGKKISHLLQENPSLLQPRTIEQVQHELEVELESAQQKIAALKTGGNWKEIHIT